MLLSSLRKLRIDTPSPPLEGRAGERRAWAFTLIELMVVIAILGIILTVSIPAVYRYFHPNPLQKALDEILEACRDARELAVLQTRTTALVIDLRSKSISVRGASAPPPEASAD